MRHVATRLKTSCLGCCLLVLGWPSFSAVSEPQAAEAPHALMRRGTEADRCGRSAEAIAAYEALLRNDARFELVVAPRLVTLYCDRGQSAEALAWATRVARSQPVPKAYLAAIYGRLGQSQEAEQLLRQALSEERVPSKRLPLCWQLAEVQEAQKDWDAALATLEGVCETIDDVELKKITVQRLGALRARYSEFRQKQAKPRGTSKPEVKP